MEGGRWRENVKMGTYGVDGRYVRRIYQELHSGRVDGVMGREPEHQREHLVLYPQDPHTPVLGSGISGEGRGARTTYWLSPLTSMEKNHFSKLSALRRVIPAIAIYHFGFASAACMHVEHGMMGRGAAYRQDILLR